MKYELIAIFCYTCVSTGGGGQGKRIGKLEKGLEALLQVILHL